MSTNSTEPLSPLGSSPLLSPHYTVPFCPSLPPPFAFPSRPLLPPRTPQSHSPQGAHLPDPRVPMHTALPALGQASFLSPLLDPEPSEDRDGHLVPAPVGPGNGLSTNDDGMQDRFF